MAGAGRHRTADDAGRSSRSANSSARSARSRDAQRAIGGLFLWINAGRLPLLILMILALGVFAIAGASCCAPAHRHGAPALAGLDRRSACRGGHQPAGDPRHQPRHRPHHPARRNLCGRARPISSATSPRFRSARYDQDLPGRVRLKDVSRQLAPLSGTRQPRVRRRFRSAPSVLLVDRDARASSRIAAPADLHRTTTTLPDRA